jgi:L-ascorbate metabolism protein UlaG (beta-lactamase superfamily)
VIKEIPALTSAERIKSSPNFRDGVFHNQHPTEIILPGVSFFTMLREFFAKPSNSRPKREIPVVKSNLKIPGRDKPIINWFGHSSYLIRYEGKNILVDPVFSGRASPVPFFIPAFKGSNYFQAEHMPEIDYLIITHNHYDHMDKRALTALRSKVKQVLLPLGVSPQLQKWGFDKSRITEFDWWESLQLRDDMSIVACPARHFTGRGTKRNESLWGSFMLQLGKYRIYIGSDSGYDDHFKIIGREFGPVDLAILENGQYGKHWPYIHMTPEEMVQASMDLNAKLTLPVHWGKFALSTHPWTEPIERVLSEARKKSVKISTPMIGEPIILGEAYPAKEWWKEYD